MRQCLYCQKNIETKNGQAVYCSQVCGNKYRKVEITRQFEPIKKKNRNCKYCKSSSHEGYCCDEHKRLYKEIRQNIKIAKSKPKRKPTEKQLKEYRKIEYALINSQH